MTGDRHDLFPFELDRFQVEALAAIDRDESVLVAAPTGAGKTVVAEYAVDRAVRSGARAFYTTPIKALSNQKFRDLRQRYGNETVGLLTGDNSVNGDAPVVVMTTEVLRNMLYAGSAAVDDLAVVVLDEVHYLQDRYRGPVWEEVIIHLPAEVRLVCLSATVSNADELAAWVGSVRGSTTLVVERHRPIELEHLYAVAERGGRTHVLPLLSGTRPNPEGERFDVSRGRGRSRGRGPVWVTPRREEVVDVLAERGMLPAIYFLFSRAGCDEAVERMASAGIELTTAEQRVRITAIIEEHVAGLDPGDATALGLDAWGDALCAGIAGHHAGMIPPCKEAVEACFQEGLIPVVFATETLALGINMPARSVVIERLTKFNGETHELLTPGQYTQLTGRAGRRGLDEVGQALVLWSPWIRFRQVARLAASREYTLQSAFRPGYNMAVNLVRRHDAATAHDVLRRSYAQYQTDRAGDRARRRVDDLRGRAIGLRQAVEEALGPGTSFEDAVGRPAAAADRRTVEEAVRLLRPGSVIRIEDVPYAVLSVAQRGPYSHVRFVDATGAVSSRHSTSLPVPPASEATLVLPVPFLPKDPRCQAEMAQRLAEQVTPGATEHAVVSPALRRQARKAQRAADELGRAEDELVRAGRSLVVQFDAVLGVLEGLGYLDGWNLTARGDVLAGIYHESDLFVAELLTEGVLDGLGPAELAGVLSVATYEHRSPDEPPPVRVRDRAVRGALASADEVWTELAALEDEYALPLTRRPDPTFLPMAVAWAQGEGLAAVLEDEDLSGGDFVRNVKQLVDVLRQVALVAPDRRTRESAREAGDHLRRGVVAASTWLVEP